MGGELVGICKTSLAFRELFRICIYLIIYIYNGIYCIYLLFCKHTFRFAFSDKVYRSSGSLVYQFVQYDNRQLLFGRSCAAESLDVIMKVSLCSRFSEITFSGCVLLGYLYGRA